MHLTKEQLETALKHEIDLSEKLKKELKRIEKELDKCHERMIEYDINLNLKNYETEKVIAEQLIKASNEISQNMKTEKSKLDAQQEQLDIPVVMHSNLRLGAKVVDGQQNRGVITSIEDKHNVEVQFDNGGAGLWCFVEDCDEYIKDSKDVLYYCE